VSTELETYLSGAATLADPAPRTQCLGVTKSNGRCRRAPTKGKSFCHQHNALADNVKSGVIQGSPDEFTVFIDDMIPAELDVLHGIKLGNVSVASVLFADDTNLLSYTAKGLQSLLDTAYEWSSKWGIKFHPQKSNVLVLGVLPASLPTFKLGNAVLEYADSVRLLGIEFSSTSAPKRNELAATNEMIRRLPLQRRHLREKASGKKKQ
jgi:hypothetical protein